MKTRTITHSLVLAAAIASLGAGLPARAETSTQSGVGLLTAPVHVDFSIVIPRFLKFRVGTDGATIDLITFTVAAGSVGNAVSIPGTGGDLGTGSVTVTLFANGGQTTITETNNSVSNGLQNASGDKIPYTEITTSSSDAANLPAPTLSNAGGNTSQPVLTGSSRVTNRSASWTYAYANSAVVGDGTYGTVTSGGRVAYTATMP